MLEKFILLLPCFVCLHSAATLFFRRKSNFRSQNIWMICMLLMSVCFYIWSIYYEATEGLGLNYKMNIIDITLALAFFPFVFLYFRSLTNEAPLSWKDYLWFLPCLIIGTSSLFFYIYMGEELSEAYMHQLLGDYRNRANFITSIYKMHYFINIVCYYTVFVVQIVLGMRYTIINLVDYRKRLENFYSSSEDKSLENMKAMLIGTLALLVIFLLGIIEAYVFLHQYRLLVCLLMGGYAVVLYYLNYWVVNVKYTAESLGENLQQADREAEEQGYVTNEEADEKQPSGLMIKKGRREEIILRMNTLLDEEQIFLKKDIRMDDMVRLTQANRTYISFLIGEEYQCNFSELINGRRIDYAQRLALSNPNLTHAKIAERSGFTHASTFSRTFKQYTGMTFKEWYRENFPV